MVGGQDCQGKHVPRRKHAIDFPSFAVGCLVGFVVCSVLAWLL